MPADLKFEPSPDQLKRIQDFLGGMPDAIGKASRDSLNRAIDHGRTVVSTDLAEAMSAKKSAVNKRLKTFRARVDRLSAALYIRGKRGLNLAGFSARQTKSGVTAKIFNQPQTFSHAFITRGLKGGSENDVTIGQGGGNKIVALRDGSKRKMTRGRYASRIIRRGPRAGQPILRQPLKALYGPTAAETFLKTPGVKEHADKEISAALDKSIDQNINRFLKS